MSEKVLSQDEISALLEAVGSEKAPQQEASEQAAPKRKKSGVEVGGREGYLFPMSKTTELGKDIETSLALIFDAFAHKGSASFSNVLRTQVAFRVHEVEQIFYGDFVESLPEPSSMWYLGVQPQNQQIGVCLEPELVTNLVAVMLGGTNLGSPKNRTQITELEQSIVESVVGMFCHELKQAWSRLSEVEFEIEHRETRPRLLRVYPANEIIVTLGMSMKIASTEGTIYWGIPSGLLATIKDGASHKRQIESQEQFVEMINRMKNAARTFQTSIEAELEPTAVSIGELSRLKRGDVLTLDHLVTSPAVVRINGTRKFFGEIVLANERRSVRLVGSI